MDSKFGVRIRCPDCSAQLGTIGDLRSTCPGCGFTVKRVAGVPTLWSGSNEADFDLTRDASSLPRMDSATVAIPFVQNAIRGGSLVLELGAGTDVCNVQNLVKTDAFVYSSLLDMCVDAHNMPFEDASFDFVYSLAVFEHLHSPWTAAKEIFRVLKPGGEVYTLCAFNQHVHGYPSHYFNMTGIFTDF